MHLSILRYIHAETASVLALHMDVAQVLIGRLLGPSPAQLGLRLRMPATRRDRANGQSYQPQHAIKQGFAVSCTSSHGADRLAWNYLANVPSKSSPECSTALR